MGRSETKGKSAAKEMNGNEMGGLCFWPRYPGSAAVLNY